jgi:hypothetical protein
VFYVKFSSTVDKIREVNDMRNSSRVAIEEYNEKMLPVMAHKPSTQGSRILQNMRYYFAVNEKLT